MTKKTDGVKCPVFNMKKIILIILSLWGTAYAQSKGYFRYDSVQFEKGGGNSEFILLNGTRAVTGGVLTNVGNGRTRFVAPAASTVTSVGLTVTTPASPAFSVSNSPITTSGNIALNLLGTTSQYIRGDGSLATTASTGTGNLLNINQNPHSGIIMNQDSIVIFGDSYVYGTGATSPADGWASVLSKYMNAILDNRGVDGTSIEKRSPINWVGGAATNMIDLLPTVPVKTFKKKLLILAFGLNDWGYNGGQYNPVNYKTDYDSVMNYCINTKGWPAENILIIPQYWIGTAGRSQYAGYSGNGLPDYAQALVFIDSTKSVANQWGTLYFNIYQDQLRNDTTLFNVGNPIHADDSGHLYIAKDIYAYLAPNIQMWKQNKTNELMPYFASNSASSTTTPASINLGASYASSAGLPGSTKIKLYYDNTTNNTAGFGISTSGLESYVFSAGTFDYYVNASKIASIGASNTNFTSAVSFSGYGAGALTTDASGNITAVSDERLKTNIQLYKTGLREVMKLNPITYKYNAKSKLDTVYTYAGFSAQNVKANIPHATGLTKDGYLTLQDRPILAALVNSIQELYSMIIKQQKEIEQLKKQIKNQ